MGRGTMCRKGLGLEAAAVIAIAAGLLAFAACGDDASETGPGVGAGGSGSGAAGGGSAAGGGGSGLVGGGGAGLAGPATLQGGAQKGPLVLGSSVMVSMLDAAGNPTGQVFNTSTLSDLGEFTVVVTNPGNAELIAQGFYFNEASGSLSGAAITLHALAAIEGSGTQQSYLNVITHMGYRRVLQLHRSGTALPEAVAQAEGELRSALGIIYPGTDAAAGTGMNLLGGDTPDSQYLFAVSCILAAASASDAEQQELINGIALDLEPDGQIDAATVERLADAEMTFDPSTCGANLEARILATGSGAVVPNIDQAWDTDKDDSANATDDDDDGDGANDADDCLPLSPVAAGPWCDATSGLCWTSFVAAAAGAVFPADASPMCEELALCGHDDWRLPTISEFRTLIRGCPANEAGGACGVTDECATGCDQSECTWCSPYSGPSADGCYFDTHIATNFGCGEFFSATPCGLEGGYWGFYPATGGISCQDMEFGQSGPLCVRPND